MLSGLPELVFTQVAGQFVKGRQQKLTQVYERDAVDFEVHVALHVVGYDGNFSMTGFNS